MASSVKLSLLVLNFLAIVKTVQSIDCYVCTSANGHCGENPNTAQLIISGQVESGCTSCVKEFSALGTIWSSVTRRCGAYWEASDSCYNVLGYGSCFCTTSFCNHGNSVSAKLTYLLGTLLLFHIVKHYLEML